MSLTTGQMNAYRFIRNHFNIPKDIELDSKFGPWSGICFEERIIRAYTLSQLVPRSGEASWSRPEHPAEHPPRGGQRVH